MRKIHGSIIDFLVRLNSLFRRAETRSISRLVILRRTTVTSQKLGVFVALRCSGNTVASLQIEVIWIEATLAQTGFFSLGHVWASVAPGRAVLPERVWVTKRNIYPNLLRSYGPLLCRFEPVPKPLKVPLLLRDRLSIRCKQALAMSHGDIFGVLYNLFFPSLSWSILRKGLTAMIIAVALSGVIAFAVDYGFRIHFRKRVAEQATK
ncbi:MAG: hypothetical protein KAU38_02385 [Desulfobacterales bacterium]|nr:hypothetical protein [Desulfobacterales bacterium]